jgi:hypothetical protein
LSDLGGNYVNDFADIKDENKVAICTNESLKIFDSGDYSLL